MDNPERDVDEREAGRLLGDLEVRYTVRELLSRMEQRLIETNSRLDHMEASFDKRFREVESFKNKMAGAALMLGLLMGGGVGYMASLFGGV